MRRLAAILALCATPFMAHAQNCAPSISVILGLDRWGEVEIEALERDGIEWRMWLNEVTGSWSLTGTKGGMTCILAAGRSGYAGQTIKDYLDGPSL